MSEITGAITAPSEKVVRPEWIRLPAAGKLCPYSGLSRSLLNQFILPCRENGGKPYVRSICLRKPGRQRGVRLISYESLMAFIARQADQQAEREVER